MSATIVLNSGIRRVIGVSEIGASNDMPRKSGVAVVNFLTFWAYRPRSLPIQRRTCRYGTNRPTFKTMAMAETNPDEAVEAFVKHYYSTFDTNRPGIAQLYRENSMMTFEGKKFKGLQNIVNMFNSLPFPVCHHDISTVDCQPYGPPGSVLAFVTGTLNVPGQEHPLKFSEMFNLILIEDTFYVLNAIVRSNKA